MAKPITKYGMLWKAGDEVAIELESIRRDGKWKNLAGNDCGIGLAGHMKALDKLLWPNDDWHKWSELLNNEFCAHKYVGVLGAASTGKTHDAAKFALKMFFAFSNSITILVSSTDIRGLELRVWGEIKKYWIIAKRNCDWLPGRLVDSKHCIATDDIEEVEARDLRNAIICIPCVINGSFRGIGRYCGLKNEKVMLVADEGSIMEHSFLDGIANLNKNPWFKCICLGNPLDPSGALEKICEPRDEDGGWAGRAEPDKTTTWDTRFPDGRAINLIGTDSPNFDVPEGVKAPYPYLITRKAIEEVVKFWGMDSHHYYSQCKGVLKMGLEAHRVITRAMCNKHHAFNNVVWRDTLPERIFGIDAAYGNVGGDRCVGMCVEFGQDKEGKQILSFHKPKLIPVSVHKDNSPEDQIAQWVMQECGNLAIPPENVFHDATGRGSLGTAFARIWSSRVNPVEFGGRASERIAISDSKLTGRDLYSNFVTELWYSVRYAIEADQIRNLPQDVAEEGYQREWKTVRSKLTEIESKSDMKKRTGRSPDLMDCAAICLEGARQRGFNIQKFSEMNKKDNLTDWFRKMSEDRLKRVEKRSLVYA